MKQFNKHILIIILSLFSSLTAVLSITAQSNSTYETRITSEKTENITSLKSSINITSNIKYVSVILNGEKQGITPITIEGLVPGIYHIQLEKKGYKSINAQLELKPYRKEYYYLELSEE